jgi:K(+)-stimulated pyrophosphate-energized sodium pump
MLAGGITNSEPAQAINAGKYLCAAITAVFSIVGSWVFFGNFNCAVCILIGMLIGALNGKIARTYHSGTSRRLKKLAERSQNGYLIVGEYGIGMLSTLWPTVFLCGWFLLTANAFCRLLRNYPRCGGPAFVGRESRHP